MVADDVGEKALKPLEYFKHDVHSHDNDKMDDLISDEGFDAYGRFWVLAELIASWHGHTMSRDNANRMRQACFALRMDEDDLIGFVDMLASRTLVDTESWRECGVVIIPRVSANAMYAATKSAAGKQGGRPAKKR
jgi:hypothetical protein